MNATVDPARSLADLVTERESRGDILEKFGLDFCCGGRKSLRDACSESRISLPDVVRALDRNDATPPPAGAVIDWRKAPLRDFLDHIVGTHHVYLRHALPALQLKVDKVAQVHGERHTELWNVREIFSKLKMELETHLAKEEDVVFPAIRRMEAGIPLPESAMCELEDEHQKVGDALHEIRRITNSYRAPADACPTYRAMLSDLAALEADTHHHVHKENNVLLPRARGAARKAAGR
ncbi:MAG: iron-sulfur cluster repair di-iron protein [Planctomycetota bacterium]